MNEQCIGGKIRMVNLYMNKMFNLINNERTAKSKDKILLYTKPRLDNSQCWQGCGKTFFFVHC